MSTKTMVWMFVFIGSTIGAYLPVWLGGSLLSLSSVFWSAVGGIIGIVVGVKVGQSLNGRGN